MSFCAYRSDLSRVLLALLPASRLSECKGKRSKALSLQHQLAISLTIVYLTFRRLVVAYPLEGSICPWYNIHGMTLSEMLHVNNMGGLVSDLCLEYHMGGFYFRCRVSLL